MVRRPSGSDLPRTCRAVAVTIQLQNRNLILVLLRWVAEMDLA